MLFAVPLQVKSQITPQPDMPPSSPFVPQGGPTARQLPLAGDGECGSPHGNPERRLRGYPSAIGAAAEHQAGGVDCKGALEILRPELPVLSRCQWRGLRVLSRL